MFLIIKKHERYLRLSICRCLYMFIHYLFQCARRAGLSPSEVQQCAESTEGINLQLDHEYQTKLIRPTFIPTITIGKVICWIVSFDQKWRAILI